MGLHGRRLTLVLSTLLAVLVVVGAAAAFAVGRSQRMAADGTGTHATAPGTPAGGGSSAPRPDVASRPSTPAPSPSATPDGEPSASAAPAPPSSSAGSALVAVDLSARAEASPDAQPVADLLGRYFTAINKHDYDAWLATVSTSQAQRPRDKWIDSYRTTRDEGIYVSDLYRKGKNLLVRIQFVSHQAVDKAPAALPVACIRWDVTYQIVDEGTGLRVGNSAEKPSMATC